jgi:hypothetical protein
LLEDSDETFGVLQMRSGEQINEAKFKLVTCSLRQFGSLIGGEFPAPRSALDETLESLHYSFVGRQ